MELYRFDELYRAIIIKRPSKSIKSPYVADISLFQEDILVKHEFLGHTPSLGCCGLAEKDSIVWVSKLGEKTKCDYRVQISEINTKGHKIYIGIAPKIAETLVYKALQNNLIQHLNVKTISREKTILNSRFDFVGKTIQDNYYICEVKNVPLASYANVSNRELKTMNFDTIEYNKKISYFPDGYRKTRDATVSERALKHVTELTKIKLENHNIRCILLFVIQRTDVKYFQPSRLDPIYLEAVQEAWNIGVEIKCLQVKWDKNVCYYYSNELPIMLYDDYNIDL